MKIRNTALLKRRVNSNVKEDELYNGAYAELIACGKKKAMVCGIGCLGLPHTIKDRLALFKSEGSSSVDDGVLIDNLGKEFGICPALARLLEAIFVGVNQGGQKETAKFLRKFARLLPEGQTITASNVYAFCRKVGLPFNGDEYHRNWAHAISWTNSEKEGLEVADKLYQWLKGGARVAAIS